MKSFLNQPVKTVFIFIFLIVCGFSASAQLSMTTVGTPHTVNFTTTVAAVNNGSFGGVNIKTPTVAGDLDKNAWDLQNVSGFGAAAYPGTNLTNGGGITANASTSGKFYSFTVGAGNQAFGVYGSGSVYKTARITLKVVNNTGFPLIGFDIAYNALSRDRGGVGSISSLNFAYSQNNTSYTAVSSMDYTTGTSTSWTPTAESASITGLTIPVGGIVYLQWSIDDVFNFLSNRDDIAIDDISITPRAIFNYYSKSTGNLNDVTTWGLNTDGSGASPANFTSLDQIFNIRNNASPTLSAAWAVSGNGAKVILGDGTNPVSFTVPPAFAFTGPVDVSNNASLILLNNTVPAIGTVGTNTTVEYGAAGAQTILAKNYFNLVSSGAGARTLASSGTIGISNVFTKGTNAYTVTGSTVNFNGTVSQFIPAMTYNNLTSSSTGARTLDPSANIQINGTFTAGSNIYTVTNTTVVLNSSTSQTLPALAVAAGPNYNNLTISGSATYTLGGSMVVGGDFNMSNGTFVQSNSSTLKTVTVNGNMALSGTASYNFSNSSGATSVLNLKGNISSTGSSQMTTSGSATNGTLQFGGSVPQNYTVSTPANWSSVNYLILSGSNAILNSNVVLDRSSTAAFRGVFTVNGGGQVTFPGNQQLVVTSGSSTGPSFTLNAGATLSTANPNGVLGASGSVVVTGLTSTFNAAANYIFTGSAAQNAALSGTSPVAQNITIANTSATGVTFTTATTTINGVLNFISGKAITTGTNKIVISTTGSVTNAGAGKYVVNNLEKKIPAAATAVSFEIGDVSYAPFSLTLNGTTNATGGLIGKATAGSHPQIINSGIDNAKDVNRYWTITNNAVTGITSYNAVFQFNDPTDYDAGANPSAFVVRHFTGGIWQTTTASNTNVGEMTVTGLTTFSDFSIGETTGPPFFTFCPGIISVNNTPDQCAGIVDFNATASGVPSPSLTYDFPNGGSLPVGQTTVTATATNINGSATCVFIAEVLDVQGPTFTGCPGPQTLPLGSGCTATIPDYISMVSVTDNCSQPQDIIITQEPEAGELVVNPGSFVVTLTAYDAIGNFSTCSFTVTKADVTAPAISCPSNRDIYLNSSCTVTVPDYRSLGTYSDNCTSTGAIVKTQIPAPGSTVTGTGPMTVTLTAKDASNNSSSCSFTVTKLDTIAPVINCPADTVIAVDANCALTLPDFRSLAVSTEACGALLIQSPAPGTIIPGEGVTVVTITATDGSSNQTSCSFNVTRADLTGPVIGCLATQIVYVDASCEAVLPDYASGMSITDNCTPTGSIVIVQNPAPGTQLSGAGILSVTVTATDLQNNVSVCSFNVAKTDTVFPVIAACPSDINIQVSACLTGSTATWTAPTATDNCSGLVFTSNHNPGDFFPAGTTAVIYTATDGSGNVSVCSFNVVITQPAPVVASAVVTAPIICIGDSATVQVSVSGGNGPYTGTGFFQAAAGSNTYIVTDADGCSDDVTIVVAAAHDAINPVISNCPSNVNIAVSACATGSVASWTPPTASDNCAGVVLTSNHNPGDVFPVGTTVVTYTATDAQNNVATCSFNVVITQPAPVVASAVVTAPIICIGDSATVLVSATGGNAPYSGTGSFQAAAGSNTYIVTDADGCSDDVTIVVAAAHDVINPVISNCPSNINIAVSACATGSVASWTPPTASDNCAGVVLTSNHNPGDVFPVGTTVVTYTATDAQNNVATCSFNVVITQPAPVVASAVVTAPIICIGDSATVQVSVSGGNSPYTGTGFFQAAAGSNTYIVTDADGCSDDVTIVVAAAHDVINPVISNCPSNVNVTVSACAVSGVASWTPPTASDNCAGVVLSSNHNPGDVFPVGTSVVTYTATDAQNNVATCSFNVVITQPAPVVASAVVTAPIICIGDSATVQVSVSGGNAPYNGTGFFQAAAGSNTYFVTDADGCSDDVTIVVAAAHDVINPVISNCPSNVNVTVSACAVSGVASWTPPTASDNCAGVILTSNHNPGDVFPVGTTIVTYTATDAQNNVVTCSFNVVITQPAPVVASAVVTAPIICIGDSATVLVSATGGNAPYTGTGSFQAAEGSNTYIVTDANGCSDDVTIVVAAAHDVINPVISNCPSNVNVTVSACAVSGVASWTPPTASDNCAGVVLTSNHNPGDVFPVGTTVVTYTATDAQNNVVTCSFNVVVTQPAPVVASAVVTAPIICIGDSATVLVSATGGNAPYTGTGSFQAAEGSNTYIVTDANGCSDDVTIVVAAAHDAINPVISNCPSNVNVTVSACALSGVASWTAPTASDNCAGVVLTSNHNPGDVFPVGTTVVTYTATDAQNNVVTCSFNVVVSQPAPVVASAVVTAPSICIGDSATVLVSATGGNAPYSGTGSFQAAAGSNTYIVTDANGCSDDVTIVVAAAHDAINPVISNCPSNVNVTVSACAVSGVASWTPPTASDNCAGVVLTSNHNPGDVFPVGTTVVTYTATDAQNNVVTCSFNVVITPASPVVASAVIVNPIACNGGVADVNVMATGGNAPYTGTGIVQVSAGPHTFIVTDINGCSDDVTITVTEPQASTANALPTAPVCADNVSTVTLTATVGGSATTGTWSGGNGGSFSSNGLTAVYVPVSADYTAGTVTFTFTSNAPATCPGAVATTNVVFTTANIYYADADNDGFGAGPAVLFCSPSAPAGYSALNTDCNDGDASINPAAIDICNNLIDDNCDGNIDETNISISGFTPSSGVAGNAVVISGNNFTGVTSVLFNGISASFSVDNNGQITATVPVGVTDGLITVNSALCSAVSATPFTVLTTVTVNMQLFIQGYYIGGGQMTPALFNTGMSTDPNDVDSVTVELHDVLSTSDILESVTGILKVDGTLQVQFSSAALNQSFYLVVRQRNSIETWSKLPVTLGTNTNYDFIH